MKILIITKSFPETPEDWRGIFVKEQADALSTEHTVTLVKCVQNKNNFSPFFKYSLESATFTAYKYYTIKVSKSFPVYNQFNYLISLYFALRKIIKQNKPEIIHCHSSYPSGVVAWLIKRTMGIPYVITEHTRLSNIFRSVFHKKLSLAALRKACCVISVSNSLKEEIMAEKIQKVYVIPNVIDTGRFQPAEKKTDPFVLGFLGPLNDHNKGLGTLLTACADLPFNFILKVGGMGTLDEYFKDNSLKGKMEDKIVRDEKVNLRRIKDFYADINLVVLPSRYETFGMVLLEAMASGIPVAATRCGGPNDIVTDKTGILTEVDNPSMLRDAIIKIHSDYKKYDSEEIRNYVISTFGFNPFLKRINSIYQSCLSK
jgi:glycosyltransferase involved in cell wall biosynthesis